MTRTSATVVVPGLATTVLSVILLVFIGAVWAAGYAEKRELKKPTEKLIAAFQSQKWWSLACSFFAAAFGASALVANPEAGATGGWIQVLAYGIANGLPYFVLAIIGPKIQLNLKGGGFTIADFALARYGLTLYIPTVILSIGFLFIWLTAELTSIADSFSILSPDFYYPAAPIAVGFGVSIYALFAGFRGSIFTDRIQALMALICTLTLVVAVTCYVPVSREALTASNISFGTGLSGSAVLILSTTLNQFLDLGSWQRVFASEDATQAKIGLVVAGGVNFVCQSLMTFMGIYAMGAASLGLINLDPGDEALGFYHLLGQIPLGFNIIALICVVILSVSTVDSIENSLAAAFAHVCIQKKHSLNWCRLFSLILIGCSISLATTRQSVLSLFLLSNIFSSCIVPPIFLGLSRSYSSSRGALTGFCSSVILIFVIGLIVEKGDFLAALQWPMFTRGFAHWTTLLTFVACPITSLCVTLLTSILWPDSQQLRSTETSTLSHKLTEEGNHYLSPSSISSLIESHSSQLELVSGRGTPVP